MTINEVCLENGDYGKIFLDIVNKYSKEYDFVEKILNANYTKVYDTSISKYRYESSSAIDVLSSYKYDPDTIFYPKSLEYLKDIKYPTDNYVPITDDITEGVTELEFPCVQLKDSLESYMKSLSRKNRSDIQRKLNKFKGTINNVFNEDCVKYYLDKIRKDGDIEADALHIIYCYARYLNNKEDVISCTLLNEEGTIDTFACFVHEEFGWHAVCNHGSNGTIALFHAMNEIRNKYGDINIFIDISYNLKASFSCYFRCLYNNSISVHCVFYSPDCIHTNVPDIYYSADSKSFKNFSDFDLKERTLDECIEYNKNNPLFMYPLLFYKKYNVKGNLFLYENKNSKLDGLVYSLSSTNIVNLPYTYYVDGIADELAEALKFAKDSWIRHLKCDGEDKNKLLSVNIPSITIGNTFESYFSSLKSSRRNKIKRCLKSIDNYIFEVSDGLNDDVLEYYINTIDKHKNPEFEYAVMAGAYAFDVIKHNVKSIAIKDKEGNLLGGDVLVIDYDKKIVYCWAGHTNSDYNDLGTLLMYKDLEYVHSLGKFNGWLFEPTFLETMPWEGSEYKCDFSDWYKLHFSNGMQTGYILNVAHEAQDYYTKPYYSYDKGWQLN